MHLPMPARDALRPNGVGAEQVPAKTDQATLLRAVGAWIASQTLWGVTGIVISVTPNSLKASRTALIMTAGAAVVPPSPPALMPSGLVGDNTSAISVRNVGK